MKALHRIPFVLLLLAAAAGCEGSTAGGGESPAGDASGSDTVYTDWQVGGTYKVPGYHNGCRLKTESHLEMASNGAPDDSVHLGVKSGNSWPVEIVVSDGDKVVVDAQVTVLAGLSGRSYRNASGTATLSGIDGTIVEGTLCFESKLAAGQGVAGEFSLVMTDALGDLRSVGGDFSLAAGDVIGDPAVVSASSVDVDLQ